MTWDDVVAVAAAFPGVEPSTSYGTPALKVRGKLLTRLRPELASVVLFDVVEDEKAMLIAADPAVFHTTAHYDGYPAILARLDALDPQRLARFLDRRWRSIAPRRAVAARDAGRDRPPSPP